MYMVGRIVSLPVAAINAAAALSEGVIGVYVCMRGKDISMRNDNREDSLVTCGGHQGSGSSL